MAKKTNPQILSPENYIRQRARNLPLYHCYINDDWEDNGLAQITIARSHINGNLTFCSYLVDVRCLGIKDTFYDFNTTVEKFEEYIDKQETILHIIEADYNLVHNIIHAGWEFAAEIGFKPHRDFISTTQFMLEEDNDDIPIIDIHCGDEEGKPFYIQGPFEDQAKANRILNQLEKSMGDGNFHFFMEAENQFGKEVDEFLKEKIPDYEAWKTANQDEFIDEDEDWDEEDEDWDEDDEDWDEDDEDWDEDDEDWDEDDEDWDEDDEDDEEDYVEIYEDFFDEYAQNSFEENSRLFLEMSQFLEDERSLTKKEDEEQNTSIFKLEALTDLLYMELVDEDDVMELINKWRKEEDGYKISYNAFNQMIGLPDDYVISDEEINFLQTENDEKAIIEFFKKRWEEIPFITYLEVEHMKSSKKRTEKIVNKLKEYPDNALLRIEESMAKIAEDQLNEEDIEFKAIFGSRTMITPFEYNQLQMLRLNYFISTQNIIAIECLHLINEDEDEDAPDDGDTLYRAYLIASRISLMRIILQRETNQS